LHKLYICRPAAHLPHGWGVKMFASIAKNLFGSSNDRIVKSMQPLVQQINDREANFASLNDDAIRQRLRISARK
jgi:preprotein translocase subunit SecA